MRSLSLWLLVVSFITILLVSVWVDRGVTYSYDDKSSQRQLLSEVKALTFYAGRQTTGRRNSPISQLSCVGGNAGCSFTPSVVLCQQVGDEQWRCEADLPANLRFGPVEVSCEGYSSPDDEYILKGSCGLEYSLEQISSSSSSSYSSSSYGYQGSHGYGSSYSGYHPTAAYESGNSSWLGSLLTLVLFAGIGWILWSSCMQRAAADQGGPYQGNGAGYNPGFNPGGGGGGGGGGHGSYYPPGGPGCTATPPPAAAGGTGPGFYSGLAAGGLMGYLFGNRNPGYGYGYPRTGYRAFTQPMGGMGGMGMGGMGAAPTGFRTGFAAGGTRRR